MSGLFLDGQLNWALVAALVYVTVLLLGADYAWRTSRLGGKLVFMSAGALAVAGTWLLLAPGWRG
jgi:hypothetical protein